MVLLHACSPDDSFCQGIGGLRVNNHQKVQIDMDTESETTFWPGEDSEEVARRTKQSIRRGPTIDAVGNALSRSTVLPSHGASASEPVAFPSAVGGGGLMDKSEKKYTLRIMTCATEAAEDGYKWRKYGQKFIKNSPNPRSYYKCNNPRCNAKKQVERSKEDPQMLVITYEGVHLHYPNSHLFLPRPLPPKTLKPPPPTEFQSMIPHSNKEFITDYDKRSEQAEETVASEFDVQLGLKNHISEDPGRAQQGLLEDIVPFLIRSKPCSS